MSLPDAVLRERLATQTWTAHSLWLSPKVGTMPAYADMRQVEPRLKAIERVLGMPPQSLYRTDADAVQVWVEALRSHDQA